MTANIVIKNHICKPCRTKFSQSTPTQQIRILVKRGRNLLEMLPLILTICRHSEPDKLLHFRNIHATETKLIVSLLDRYFDINGRQVVDSDCDILVALLGHGYDTLHDLRFSLIHASHLMMTERSLALAVIDVGVDHIGGTKEMKHIGMCRRRIAKHIEGILEKRAGYLVPPRSDLYDRLFRIFFIALSILRLGVRL